MASEAPNEKSTKRKFTIEDVHSYSHKKMAVFPTIVSFRSVAPNPNEAHAEVRREPFDKFAQNNRRYCSRLTVSTNDTEYVGQRLSSNGADKNGTLLLGVLDKESGTMKLVEMEEYVVSKPLSDTLQSKEDDADASKITENARLQFGTKKNVQTIRAALQDKARKQNDELIAINEAAQVAAEQSFDEKAMEEDLKRSYARVLPNINENATHLSKVYGKVYGKKVLSYLKPEAADLIALGSLPDSNEKLSQLFRSCYNQILQISDEEKKVTAMCRAIFMEYLVRIAAGRPLKASEMVPEVMHYLIQTFNLPMIRGEHKTSGAKAEDVDAAVAHLIVHGLIIHNYRMPISLLHDSLKTDKMKLRQLLKLLRLTVRKDSVSLSLPLPDLAEEHARKMDLFKKKRSKF